MNDTFREHLYHQVHQTISVKWNVEFANDACFPFTVLVCLLWLFASTQFETRWDRFLLSVYTVCTASMFFRMARFLCVIYAEIRVNATPDPLSGWSSGKSLHSFSYSPGHSHGSFLPPFSPKSPAPNFSASWQFFNYVGGASTGTVFPTTVRNPVSMRLLLFSKMTWSTVS